MATCNNRNPAPPCKEGIEEKQNPKGDICCFKIPKHKIEAQKARIENKRKKELEADIAAARLAIGNAIKEETKRKMQKEKEERERVKKEKKDKHGKKEKPDKQDNKSNKRDKLEVKRLHKSPQRSSPNQSYVVNNFTLEKCNNRNPAPPRVDGFVEIKKTRKNGRITSCRYKSRVSTPKKTPRNP